MDDRAGARRAIRRLAATLAVTCLGLAGSGCGGEDEEIQGASRAQPAEGGVLAYALPAAADRLDPLVADERSSQIVTRQIHEPLVATLSGPFGDVREVPGLAESSRSSGDQTIWRFSLRERVRFQDGTPFNASAVLANAERWLGSDVGRSLLPGLTAVDAPRPNLVRFILDRPDSSFPERLSHPRLGMLSRRALRSGRGSSRTVARGNTGTGAFELREHERGGTTVLARSDSWWGSRLDLGPALDQLVFTVVPDEQERVDLLDGGEVEIAGALSERAAELVRADPLLTVEGAGAGLFVGLERSVRGIDTETGIPVLSGTWLTTIDLGTQR